MSNNNRRHGYRKEGRCEQEESSMKRRRPLFWQGKKYQRELKKRLRRTGQLIFGEEY